MAYKNCKACGSEKVSLINDKYDLLKCDDCCLVFSKSIFSDKEFEKVYNDLYNSKDCKYSNHSVKEYGNLKKGIVEIGFNRKKIINKHIKLEDYVLEIGSGIGLVGCYLKKNGFKNYTGVEIDKSSHLKAKEFDLNSINGDFKIIESLDGNYFKISIY